MPVHLKVRAKHNKKSDKQGEKMKKLLTILLLASLVVMPSCSGDKPSSQTTTGAVTTNPNVEKDVDVTRVGETGELKLHLPEEAGNTLTLLVISDLSIENEWKSHPEAVADIAEITLDENGRATTKLSLSIEGKLYLILTGTNGVRREEIPAAN